MFRNFAIWVVIVMTVVSLSGATASAASKKSSKKDSSSKKSKSKIPDALPSKATTFDEAVEEGEERIVEMDYRSAENSYKKAMTLAQTDKEKGVAYKGLAKVYNNQGDQRKAIENTLESLRYSPAQDTSVGAVAAQRAYFDNTFKEVVRLLSIMVGKKRVEAGDEALKLILPLAKTPPDLGDGDPKKSAAARIAYLTVVYDAANQIAGQISEAYDWKNNDARDMVCDAALSEVDMGREWALRWTLGKMHVYGGKIKNMAKVEEWHKNALMIPDLSPLDMATLYSSSGSCYSGMAYWNGQNRELYAQAREYFQKALDIPESKLPLKNVLGIHEAMAGTYWWSRDFANARLWYEKLLALGGNKFEVTMKIGECYQNEGNKAEATTKYQECLQMADKSHNETWRAQADGKLRGLK